MLEVSEKEKGVVAVHLVNGPLKKTQPRVRASTEMRTQYLPAH